MLATYVRLWVFAAVSRESQGFSAILQGGELNQRLRGPFGALLFCTFLAPRPVLVAAALVARALVLVDKLPLLHDSQWWVIQVDFVLLSSLFAHMGSFTYSFNLFGIGRLDFDIYL